MSGLTSALSISASGLGAQSGRLSIVAQNIANADTPGYRRKTVAFEAAPPFDSGTAGQVRLAREALDTRPLARIHDPGHPLADESGFYLGSNVSVTVEMADAREAQRSYEANLRAFDSARQMQRSLLELLRR